MSNKNSTGVPKNEHLTGAAGSGEAAGAVLLIGAAGSGEVASDVLLTGAVVTGAVVCLASLFMMLF
jgi:hypothetical protein